MKYTLPLSLFLLASLSADELSFATMKSTAKKRTATHQSLQIHSSKTLDDALESLKNVPSYHRQYVGIYQSGEYYATRYQNPAYPTILPWIIRDFKKAKFNTSFIVRTHNSIPIKQPDTQHKAISSTTPIKSIEHPPSISEHDRTRLILDAQKAYEQRDFSQATIYYEMMAAAGIKDRQILFNLCYLYGREGSFALMEKLIEGKRGINDYYYAYGVGALEAGRSDLYSTLSPQLIYDKSGRLAMLCGYFFERENNPSKAASFYKMAYNSNPGDPHILYAYARSVDIQGDKEQALTLYAQITQLGEPFEALRSASQSRIQALRRTQ